LYYKQHNLQVPIEEFRNLLVFKNDCDWCFEILAVRSFSIYPKALTLESSLA
jgi:hypothetical protein